MLVRVIAHPAWHRTNGLRENTQRGEIINAKSLPVASAAAVLLMSGAIVAQADEGASANQVAYFGINSCKGHRAARLRITHAKARTPAKVWVWSSARAGVQGAERYRRRGDPSQTVAAGPLRRTIDAGSGCARPSWQWTGNTTSVTASGLGTTGHQMSDSM